MFLELDVMRFGQAPHGEFGGAVNAEIRNTINAGCGGRVQDTAVFGVFQSFKTAGTSLEIRIRENPACLAF